jgi:hypothetical protein
MTTETMTKTINKEIAVTPEAILYISDAML